MKQALTIAGSDSGGGAGIQADLKTFAALGVYGISVLTAVTAQNTSGVQGIHELPADFVALQLDAVLQDLCPNAVKTGMFFSAANVEVVADRLRAYRARAEGFAVRLPPRHESAGIPTPLRSGGHVALRWPDAWLVVDPVMAAKKGKQLLHTDARDALVRLILPLADVITPNLDEAFALTGIECESKVDMCHAAEAVFALGARHVVVKGGHLHGSTESIDILYDGREFHEYRAARIHTRNDHGTGCTFSSAIAAGLAKGLAVPDAVAQAKRYLTEIVQASVPLNLGSGHGPLDHFAMSGRDTSDIDASRAVTF